MTRSIPRPAAALGLLLILALSLAGTAVAQAQQSQQRPPEYGEILAASRIADPAARLKEFGRLKAAYPFSVMMETIDEFLLGARIELTPDLASLLALQKTFLGQGRGAQRATSYLRAASQLIQHPKAETFDKAKVRDIVLEYRDASERMTREPETFADISNEDEKKAFAVYLANAFLIVSAKAQLQAGNAESAVIALNAYRAAGAALDVDYYDIMGDAQFKLGNEKEAYQAYLRAAADNAKGAANKALMLYVKLTGKEDGFLDALKAQIKQLPFEPEEFDPPADWKGKAVLAELFTGSECPPCVGADLAFDGLIESVPDKYLAVLEYHLPIPAPDPMINPAGRKRQAFYGIVNTPTVVIDGDNKLVGGGLRSMAGNKYAQFKAAVEARVGEAPGVELPLSAALSGDVVTAAFGSDIVAPNTDYILVLAHKE